MTVKTVILKNSVATLILSKKCEKEYILDVSDLIFVSFKPKYSGQKMSYKKSIFTLENILKLD